MNNKELSKKLANIFVAIFIVGMTIGGIAMFLIIYLQGGMCIN